MAIHSLDGGPVMTCAGTSGRELIDGGSEDSGGILSTLVEVMTQFTDSWED